MQSVVASWMLWATLLGALIFVAALAVEGGLRLARAPVRGAWVLALLVVAVTPVLLAARRAPVSVSHSTSTSPAASLLVPSPLAAPAPGVTRATTPQLDARSVDQALVAAWVLAAVVLTGRLLVAALLLRKRRASWSQAVLDGIPVLLSERDGPAVAGAVRPVIVIPRWLALQPMARRLVLTHEREHCLARDPLLLALASAVVAVMPWNPALWLLRRRVRLAVELDCDARVLAHGADARAYGSLLLAVAERHATVLAPALMEPPSFLERRIRAMIRSRPRHPVVRAGLAVSLGAMAIVVACRAPQPAPLLPGVQPRVAAPAAATQQTSPPAAPQFVATLAPQRAPGPRPRTLSAAGPSVQPAPQQPGPITIERLRSLVALNYPEVARQGSGEAAVWVLMDSARGRIKFETQRAPVPEPLTVASAAQLLRAREEALLPPWRTSYPVAGPGSPVVNVVVARVRPGAAWLNQWAWPPPPPARGDSSAAWVMTLREALGREMQRRFPEVASGTEVNAWFIVTPRFEVLRAERDARPIEEGNRARPPELDAAAAAMTPAPPGTNMTRGAIAWGPGELGASKAGAHYMVVSGP